MSLIPEKETKTLVIKAGETLVLPKGASIIAVGIIGSVTATSNCPAVQDALDNAEQYKCYSFGVGCDDDNNDTHVMNEDGALIKNIIVGGEMYEFVVDGGIIITDLEDEASGKALINNIVPKELMEVYSIVFQQFDKREQYTIKVKMLPSIAATAELYLVGTGFVNGLYVKPVLIDCPDEES